MTEEIDVVQLAADVMAQRGYLVVRRDAWLEHPDSGFRLKPVLLESDRSNSLLRSACAVTISHPQLVPHGIFEYQHAFADTLSAAVRDGFDQWLQLDFVVFLDALRDKPTDCMVAEVAVPQTDRPAIRRRAVLGPVWYTAERQGPPPGDAEHPFCPCCFVARNYETFRPLMQSDAFRGIRLFAARSQDGSVQADCRVNGQDWEAGQRALLGYVDTWPQAGLEWRKQYVIMQTLSTSS